MIYPVKKNGLYAYIDESGRLVSDFVFSYASPEFENRVKAKVGDESGFLDGKLQRVFVCDPAYYYHQFNGGRCVFSGGVESPSKKGLVDLFGEIILRPTYGNIRLFCGGLAPFSKDGWTGWGLLSDNGIIFADLNFDVLRSFEEPGGISAFWRNGKWGFVDSKGEVVIEPRYSEAFSSKEALAVVVESNVWRYIDRLGGDAGIANGAFQQASLFCEGLAAVKMRGKWGVITIKGELVVGCEYDYIDRFSNGRAVVGKRNSGRSASSETGLFGVIDINGRVVVSEKFEQIHSFRGKLAEYVVGQEGEDEKRGYINQFGDIVWEASR